MAEKLVSIIIPCYNEEKNINRTLDALLKFAAAHPKYNFEFIAVDDGSKDKTWEVIKGYAKQYPHVVGINQMRNFGQSAAYQAGFDVSKGDYVLVFSADLEIGIENIEKVLDLLEEGHDFVNTNRAGRWNNGKTRKVKSGMANWLISCFSKINMKDRGSGLKGFTRQMIENLRLYGEMHRFIPDYLSVYGAKMTEFDVEFKDRDYGKSAYSGTGRSIRVLLDLLTLRFMLFFATKPFYMMPGRLFGFTGVALASVGGLVEIYLAVLKLVYGQSIGSRPLFILGVLMIIVGIQSMMMGLLGELMLRVYFESSDRKNYTVREIIR